jgi:hypothetical protein
MIDLTRGRLRKIARDGFTVLEILVALGVLILAMLLVTEVAVWGLGERQRVGDRHYALELAANLLESAQALPWGELTPAWAAAQKLPEPLADRLTGGRLTVRVEPEKSRPRTKRVTVEVRWQDKQNVAARPIQLVGFFSARSVEGPGAKP